MDIKIKKISNTAKIPTCGSEYAAGYDLYADIKHPIMIRPNETEKIPIGIATEIPQGYYGAIQSRSGLTTKKGLRVAQGTGVIDPDYRGEWFVPIYNDSKITQNIYPQERIAQVVFMKYESVDFENVLEIEDTKRGAGGFGSSGSK